MISDPRKDTVIFEECGIYMVAESNAHGFNAINLDNGRLSNVDPDMKVYPVICNCSVSLYSNIQ